MVRQTGVMTGFHILSLFAGTALLSWLLCWWLISQLTRTRVLDWPNERSLHDAPVPRGAGLAIVAAALLGIISAGRADSENTMSIVLLSVFGCAYAGLGWLDDRRRRSVSLRLGVQVALAIVFAVAVSSEGGYKMASPWLLPVVATLLVWHVNLFNFMDGADGYSGIHALTVALGMVAIDRYHGGSFVSVWGASVAGAVIGYLWWNWTPARIFMGDSGSYFLGFQLAAIIFLAANTSAIALLVLISPFVVDASLTLLLRIWGGKAWWRGHRQHAYQRLVLSGWSPDRLATTLAIYNICICWPLAWAATTSRWQVLPIAVAYLLAAMMWLHVQHRFKAEP